MKFLVIAIFFLGSALAGGDNDCSSYQAESLEVVKKYLAVYSINQNQFSNVINGIARSESLSVEERIVQINDTVTQAWTAFKGFRDAGIAEIAQIIDVDPALILDISRLATIQIHPLKCVLADTKLVVQNSGSSFNGIKGTATKLIAELQA